MKKYIIKFLFVIISVSFSAKLYAQEYDDNGNEIKEFPFHLQGLQYGFNFGAYIPNNKIASYYNGLGPNLNLYNTIISTTVPLNSYNYNYLNYTYISQNVFGGNGFEIVDYPKMAYSVAANVGFHAKYNFTNRLGVYIEFNYTKLKAEGAFALQPINGYSIQAPQLFDLIDYESRVDINLGIMKTFGKPSRFMPYAEGALNLNNTRVLSANAYIGNQVYNYQNPDDLYYNIRHDGIGNGGLIGGGFQIIATQTIIMHMGVDFCLKKINLGGNNAYSLNTIFYIRLLFYKLLSTTKPEA